MDAAEAGATPVIAVRHLSKHFGGARALDGVDLTVLPGEVHGLLGQNGSGKSTLIKILAGYHAPEPGGELRVNGEQVRLPLRPGQFRELGMSFVHQDLGLIPSLTVTENLRLGELASTRRWHISWARERARALDLFGRYGLRLNPAARVADLSPIDRALLGIVRAVEEMRAGRPPQAGRGLLVLDEPTAFLPRQGTDQLFALVREIVAGGDSVLFVSHNLDEVLRITDRVTVLRDGRVVGVATTAGATEAQLVELIIGRTLGPAAAHQGFAQAAQPAIAIDGLRGGALRDVQISVGRGEVLGIAGLLGSGLEDLPYLLFGARPAEAGTIAIGGQQRSLPGLTPLEAIRMGMALVPADRQQDGSIGSLSVEDNITMRVIERYFKRMYLDRPSLRRDARGLIERFGVRPARPDMDYASLSGGNQQKVLLAKWLQTSPALLLLHEPTQGVDVGARQQIYQVIREAAATGTAVICASADYEQLADICDRVLILARGRVVRELLGTEISKDRIAEHCLLSVPVAV